MWVQSLGQEDPLEKEMATHSNILARKIPQTEDPCPSDMTEGMNTHTHTQNRCVINQLDMPPFYFQLLFYVFWGILLLGTFMYTIIYLFDKWTLFIIIRYPPLSLVIIFNLKSILPGTSITSSREGNGNPFQCSCLENPRGGRAWWAAVYGVAQNWT